ncbi:MAG: luciferase family protein [Bdellovibrionales bacterium]
MKLKTELLARILDSEDIELKKSRFSKSEALFVGTREIAHFHNSQEIDVRLTRAEIRRRRLSKSPDPRITVSSPSSDWVVAKFRQARDLEVVQELVETAAKLNAKQLKG